MAHRRVLPRPPSSAGAVGSYEDGDAPFSSSPRSANSVHLPNESYKAKSSDLSASQHSYAAASAYYNSYDTPRIASDAPSSMRHRRGGFEDPSYASHSHAPSANDGTPKPSNPPKDKVSIPVAVLLWYLLGVLSIATSKVLLSSHNVPPLVLTLQQLVIGATLLRTLLELQTSGEKKRDEDRLLGLQPIPMQCDGDDIATIGSRRRGLISAMLGLIKPADSAHIHNQLFLAAVYFAAGFLLTNCGFQSGSAAFVETVKAAEPFTSASVAVLWGIERLGKEEIASLTGIVGGVVLSTMGHRNSARHDDDTLELPAQSLATKCCVVMLANLCFSLRGLHQKLFRAKPQGKASVLDDLNLQYRMQQIGVLMLVIPVLLGNTSAALVKLQHASVGGATAKDILQYTLLALVNGLAFTSYNLASTFVLTRISVVHHAALNCVRRVFAIVVTSLLFGLRFTLLQIVGIALAVNGFFAYTHYKERKDVKTKRRRELRNKWGGFLRKDSSILPVSNAVD